MKSFPLKSGINKFALTFIAGVMLFMSQGISSAEAAVDPPTYDLFEAYGFENVLEQDDRLILIRYDVDLSLWQNTTYMVDPVCETYTNDTTTREKLIDPCLTSIKPGMLLHTFYDGTKGDPGVLQQGLRLLPRIGDGMSGLYIRAGHGLAPVGSTTSNGYRTCLEGSPTFFVPPTYTGPPITCSALIWTNTLNVQDKAGMTSVLRQMMANIEEDMVFPVNTLIAQDKITEPGVVMPREAFTSIVRAAPEAFYTGITNPWKNIEVVPTPTVQENAIQNEATSSTIYKAFDGVAAEYFGTSATVFGGLVILMVAAIAVMAVGAVTGSITLGAIMGFLFLMMGVFLGIVHVGALWATIALLTLVGSTYVFRKFPS
tara:strand:+ start:11171 stop:12286 length:1116 start_codon:yes stop_codon:yes gene_type:complete